MYRTNSRLRIMDFLKQNSDRVVSAPEIAEHLKTEGAPVNKTTIYRYLDKLESEGTVIRYADENGKHATFRLVDSAHHCAEHLHLKCISCGQVFHLDCGFMDEISEHMLKDHGFLIQCKNSVIYGYCAGCRARQLDIVE